MIRVRLLRSQWVSENETQQSHSPVDREWSAAARLFLKSGKNIYKVESPDGAQNQEQLCWQGPGAIDWEKKSLIVSFKGLGSKMNWLTLNHHS
jgi:hypothetical protein